MSSNSPTEEVTPLALASLNADLNVSSWNVLAQCYFDNTNNDGHVKDEGSLMWPLRSKRLIREMVQTNADVLCLQEVQFTHFDTDYEPELAKAGYKGLVQNDKKRNSAHPQGVATFWKADKFKLEGAVHRSRTMATMLTDSAGRTAAIVNCHLEGNPRNPQARVKQLQTTLTEVNSKHLHHALVVCGDFNCALGASSSAAYLAFGQVPQGIVEWGIPVPDVVTEIPRHNYSLTSAYEVQADVPRGFRFTFCGTPDFPVDGLDQMWYTPTALQCIATRRLHASEETRLRMIQSGLPSPDCPSDHVAVGAAFNWTAAEAAEAAGTTGTGGTTTFPNLQANAAAGDGGGGGTSAGGASAAGAGAVETAEDHLAAAEELLAACPFGSPEQRAEFEIVNADPPALPKGKPSAEQLAALKEMRVRKETLLESVDESVRQILQEIMRRKKLAKKLQQQQQKANVAAAFKQKQKAKAKAKAEAQEQAQKQKQTEKPESPLVAATRAIDLDTVRTLLDAGHEPNSSPTTPPLQSGTPSDALCMVVFRLSDCLLSDAERATFADIAALLLKHGAEPAPAVALAESRYGAYGGPLDGEESKENVVGESQTWTALHLIYAASAAGTGGAAAGDGSAANGHT